MKAINPLASINNKLQISTKQTLALTANMQASLKILRMSTTELSEHIEREVVENPFLEINYNDNEYYQAGNNGSMLSTTDIIEQTADNKNTSITEYLLEQINLTDASENIKTIMQILISYIDDDGYIKTKPSTIENENGFAADDLELAWSILKTFEPLGIASQSLEECLITQLQNIKTCEDSDKIIAIEILQNFFEDLAMGNFENIAMRLSLDLSSIEQAKELISSLEPYPARAFDNHDTQYVVPEIFIFKDDGFWTVKTNDYALPRLQINKKYTKLKERTKDASTLCYLEEQENKATSLIKFIAERENTLHKVGLALLDLQKEFFEHGKEHLKALTLKDVALHEQVGLSQSTISRLSHKKYLQTVWGVFSLKYFFSSKLKSDHSSAAVKEMIGRIITSSLLPISDEMIKNVLVSYGVDISRRTVAKYRKALKIASSRDTRKSKANKK